MLCQKSKVAENFAGNFPKLRQAKIKMSRQIRSAEPQAQQRVWKESENESENETKWPFFDSCSTLFGFFGPPGSEGPTRVFSDFPTPEMALYCKRQIVQQTRSLDLLIICNRQKLATKTAKNKPKPIPVLPFLRKRQFVHNIFVHNFCAYEPPPPNQQNDGFPLDFLLKEPQTALRTLSQNCEQTLQKLRTNRIMNKRAFLRNSVWYMGSEARGVGALVVPSWDFTWGLSELGFITLIFTSVEETAFDAMLVQVLLQHSSASALVVHRNPPTNGPRNVMPNWCWGRVKSGRGNSSLPKRSTMPIFVPKADPRGGPNTN